MFYFTNVKKKFAKFHRIYILSILDCILLPGKKIRSFSFCSNSGESETVKTWLDWSLHSKSFFFSFFLLWSEWRELETKKRSGVSFRGKEPGRRKCGLIELTSVTIRPWIFNERYWSRSTSWAKTLAHSSLFSSFCFTFTPKLLLVERSIATHPTPSRHTHARARAHTPFFSFTRFVQLFPAHQRVV